jgi:hypothetical protein
MAKKKPVKKKVSKKPQKAKAAKKAKPNKSARPKAKLAKKARPKKAAKPVKKAIARPKAKASAKSGKPVKKVIVKPVVKSNLPSSRKVIIQPKGLPTKKGGSPMHIPAKPVIILKNQPKPLPIVKPVSKVPVSPMKRDKKAITEPQEPVEPLKKVVKTFSIKNETKDHKKLPPHPNQYSIEYVLHASATLLFEVISSPSGLSEWFADDVNIRDGNFTFFWDGSTQVAKQIAYKQDKLVRFQWEGKPDYSFFEFRIETDDLTNDTSLIITDFAEDGDKESARLLWDNQINRLRKAIGS